MARMRNVAKEAGKRLPKKLRLRAKSAGKTLLGSLPEPVETKIRVAFGRKGVKKELGPADPLGLEVRDQPADASKRAVRRGGTSGGAETVVAGRAAGAGKTTLAENSERLYRALHGNKTPARTESGGRPVGGIFAPDLETELLEAGYSVASLIPGTTLATCTHVEILVIDLAGFEGVWAGALDAAGIGLFRELLSGIATAQGRGVTVWLVERGDTAHRLGALQLRRLENIEVIVPGRARVPAHYTEDPGMAAEGIVDVLRGVGENR